MMTSRVGPKKKGALAVNNSGKSANSNSHFNNSKTTNKGDSDAATPETGDEADDDRTASEKWKGEEQSQNSNLDQPSVSSSQQCGDDTEPEIRLKSLAEQQNDEGESSDATPHRRSQSRTSESKERVRQRASRISERQKQQEMVEDDSDDEEDSFSDTSRSPAEDHWLWKARLCCGKIVNNDYVQITIIFLIIVNALMMGVATADFVTDNSHIDDIFEKVDRAFLVIFTIEVAMQLFYLGITLFADGWLVFDFFIVVFSWSFESLQIVRAFRIFRAFRLITRVKPLRDLVLAIGAVLPRMYAIGALLMLVFYIFSVLFTELFKDLPLSNNYFTTLDASLFTCMEMMTLEWGEIAREVMDYYPWAWAPFVTFIAMTGFIVFNLIVAVVCDAVAVTEKTVRELDGIESENPETKLEEAQERIDLLQCHISDMLRTQLAVQDMIEVMAGELLHLEAERLKSEKREADLRLQFERRMTYERDMKSTRQMQAFERSVIMERERRESERIRRSDVSNRDEDDVSEREGEKDKVGGFGRKLVNVTVGSDASERLARRGSGSGRRNSGLGAGRRNSGVGQGRKASARSPGPRSNSGNSGRRGLIRDNSSRGSRSSLHSSSSHER